jgi:L-asparaginase
MRIKIYTTGGSIDKIYSTRESVFVIGEPQVENILREANVGFEYQIEPILRKDSLEITDGDRQQILDRVQSDPHRHILITHGTDTMIETARVLSQVSGKVIVLTGAMQPAAFKKTDAAFSIGCAVTVLQILPEGVYVVMQGRVFDPYRSRKNPKLDRFEDIP